MPAEQSAYRRGHSTETAILKILNDLVDATSNGRVALLCLLDLSAAFDTVDHQILTKRLEISYGLDGLPLLWIKSYLTDRTQAVRWDDKMSSQRRVQHGVPQGSVLGPLLFILYIADVHRIIKAFGLTPHSYADDGQIYSSCLPSDAEELRSCFTECVSAIATWMDENRLALNPDKTEFLWTSTPRRRHLLSHASFVVGDATIAPSESLRLLGVILDETLSFEAHVSNLIRSCHYQLRRVRSIRRYLPVSAAINLVRAMVLTRIDYCNGVLLGLPASRLNRLQSVLNQAARVIFGCRWGDHVTPLLKDRLHWLRVPQRIMYKRCWLTYRALNDPFCPEYLAVLVRRSTINEKRSVLRSGRRVQLLVPPPSKTLKFGDTSFMRGNPVLWNSLPDNVTGANSADLFRRNLKTHLFKTGYDLC